MLVLGWLSETFTRIGVWLISGIYHVASVAFKLFLILSNGEIVDAKSYELLIQNFYIVLGIVLLFMLSFSLLKAMVNPDDEKQGTSVVKKVVLNLITSGILIALLPTIFGFAYDFQTSFVNRNVIGKFFGYSSQIGETNDFETSYDMVDQGAHSIVNGIFTAFFNVNPESCENVSNKESLAACQANIHSNWGIFQTRETFECGDKSDDTFACAIAEVDRTGRFGRYAGFSDAVDNGEIEFNFLLALVAGFIVIYVAVSFCFDMAVRLVKLVFYQLIAPIPIFLRVVPNDKLNKTFDEWVKVTITCYMEVYVRVFIFYFVIYLCNAMVDAPFINNVYAKYGVFYGLLAKAFILMGILIFMKQVPGLLGKMFGIDSGNMKLGIGSKFKEAMQLPAAVGSGIGGLIVGRGNPLAAIRAAKSGWKDTNLRGIGVEAQRRREYKDALESGATRREILKNRLRNVFGLDSTAEAAERTIKDEARSIKNNSTSGFSYTDSNGETITINSGDAATYDRHTVDSLNAQITENKGIIAEKQKEIKKIEGMTEYANKQKEALSFIDEDGEKAWKNGKFKYKSAYIDENGLIVNKDLTYEEFTELRKMGTQFVDSTVTYRFEDASTGQMYERTFKYSEAEAGKNRLIQEFGQDEHGNNNLRVINRRESVQNLSEKNVLDAARSQFNQSELTSLNPTGAKKSRDQFLDRLSQDKFSYSAYKYVNGSLVYDDDGKPKIAKTGTVSSEIVDNKRVILRTETIYNDDGTSRDITTKYTDIGNNQYEYEKDGIKYVATWQEIADAIDKNAKSTATVYEGKVSEIMTDDTNGKSVKTLQEENAAMEGIKETFAEQESGDLQSTKQRSREAAKKYTANRNK